MRFKCPIVILFMFLACGGVGGAAVEHTTDLVASRLGLYIDAEGHLSRHGKPYRGIGVNYFNAFYRTLRGDDTSFREGFRYLKKHDIPFIRFMAGAYWPKQWTLYQTNKSAYFEKMDAFIKAAEDEDIGLIPSLFWQINTIPDLVGEPISQWGDPESKTIEFMRNYTRELVERYADSPAIWGWEFGNEMNLQVDLPEHLPQVSVENGTPEKRGEADRLSTDDMVVALTEFARVVRSIDKNRIIISGNSNPRPSAYHLSKEGSWDKDSRKEYAENLRVHNPALIDNICIHIYPEQDRKYFVEQSGSIKEIINIAMKTAKQRKKPLFIGEFGVPVPKKEETNSAFERSLRAIVTSCFPLTGMWLNNDSQDDGTVRTTAVDAKQVEHARFSELLDTIVEAGVPLAALWVFDYSPQDKDWNVTPTNNRRYQIEEIGRVNRNLMENGSSGASVPIVIPN